MKTPFALNETEQLTARTVLCHQMKVVFVSINFMQLEKVRMVDLLKDFKFGFKIFIQTICPRQAFDGKLERWGSLQGAQSYFSISAGA